MKSIAMFAVIGFVFILGCQNPGPTRPSESCPGFADAGSTRSLADEKVRFIGDPFVKIVEMRCVTGERLLRIDIDVRNQSSQEQRIAYRFEWFEDNGMSVHLDEAWKPLFLYAGDMRTIRTVSPNPGAQDFRLMIKR